MNIPEPIQKAIQAYYAERATDDDMAALEAWLREDEAHVRVFAEHGLVEWQLHCEQEKLDAAAILTLMREAEDSADPVIVSTDVPTPPRKLKANFEGIGPREFLLITGYVTLQALRTPAGIVTGIAAVLLIGVGLFFAFSGDTPPTTQAPIAAVPGESHWLGPAVATLTSEDEAEWDRRPGEDLYAGQRFTLNRGFAEIATASGAVVVLEGPASIELLDSPNALALHAGKLVGICEIESSKGLLIQTPYTDITDLGTRFGVDVDPATGTYTEVFEGKVAVKPAGKPEASGSATELLAGESVTHNPAGEVLAGGQEDADRFGRLVALGSGVAEISGQAVWLSNPASYRDGLQQWPSDRLSVFQVPGVRTLGGDVSLMVQRPGRYGMRERDQYATGRLSKGVRVRSYVVSLHPASGLREFQSKGTIRFTGQIIGVITSAEESEAFDSATGEDSEPLIAKGRVWPGENRDQITIADDRQTLTVNLAAAGGGVDMIRVLVEADQP